MIGGKNMPTNENVKTLLVIGNGFDLAHGLKTKYTNFLDYFDKNFGNIEISEQYIDIDGIKEVYQYIQKSIDNKDDISLQLNLKRYMQTPFGNIWIAYFDKIREDKNNLIGEDWIDFEQEIERVIRQVENLLLKKITSEDINPAVKVIIGKYLEESPEIIIQKFIPKLYFDLRILTLFLEEYLIEEEEKLQINTKNFFKTLNVKAVISYNYTNTFNRLYNKEKNKNFVHFIHGQLGKHNLVLGIGETLSDSDKNNFTICASFKKFFQRIKYKLGNNYRNTLPPKPDVSNKWQIIFYGHSLDTTDKDSLEWLLKKSKDFPVKIYYFDDIAYNQQIANVIQIIGKDQLIKDVNSGRIVFKPIN